MQNAEKIVLKIVQEEAFDEELKSLKSKMRSDASISKTSSLYTLDPLLDEDGLLRIGGRIKRAKLPQSIKHPIVLPKRSHVTTLVIDHYHRLEGHAGRGMALNSTRQAGYWILAGRTAVTSHIMRCISCRRLRGTPSKQKMADLPEDRLEPCPPFTYSAVDYFGPFTIREGRKELKRWGVLFSCMSSRAIHIETAGSLNTDAFLNAYRRFVCRRGPLRMLRCDKGTNFIGGKNELTAALAEMDQDRIAQELLKDECDWIGFKTNVPHASHFGGAWERMIGTARSVLSSLLIHHGNQLDDELVRTLFTEVEYVVNSRPLTYVDTNDNDAPLPLTPFQLLTLKTKTVKPFPCVFVKQDMYLRRRWRRVQYLASQFWTRWRDEILPTLQERRKWTKDHPNIRKDDVVLMIDDSLPRGSCKLGRVIDAMESEDGLVRKLRLKVGQSYFERPIHKVIPLVKSDN